jgi:ankyrin repeat protein
MEGMEHSTEGTLLMWASYNGHLEVAELLIQKGATVNIKDDWGYTALDWALRNNHTEMAALLINAGAKKGDEISE